VGDCTATPFHADQPGCSRSILAHLDLQFCSTWNRLTPFVSQVTAQIFVFQLLDGSVSALQGQFDLLHHLPLIDADIHVCEPAWNLDALHHPFWPSPVGASKTSPSVCSLNPEFADVVALNACYDDLNYFFSVSLPCTAACLCIIPGIHVCYLKLGWRALSTVFRGTPGHWGNRIRGEQHYAGWLQGSGARAPCCGC
jgi:hypothetical protein